MFVQTRPYVISDEAYNLISDNKATFGLPSGHCSRFTAIYTYICLTVWFSDKYQFSKKIKILITFFGILAAIIVNQL